MEKELLEKANELSKKIESVNKKIITVNSTMDSNRAVAITNDYDSTILNAEQKIMFLSMLQYQLAEELSKLQVEFERL